MKNAIGIDKQPAKKLSILLNELLANYQLYYQNLRGFHWNIKGKEFFELHLKFEELYTAAQLAIDEIAERILTLGEQPLHTFSDYTKLSEIKEAANVSIGKDAIAATLQNLTVLLVKERAILNVANDVSDEGTATLMSDYIKLQEKTVWMLNAYNS